MTNSGWQKYGAFSAIATAFLLVASFLAVAQTGNQSAHSDTKKLVPTMAGALPSLPGTAWKIDFGKGVTGTVFLFCKSGRWEIVPSRAGSIGAVGKSYKVSGKDRK